MIIRRFAMFVTLEWNHAAVDQYYGCTRAILQPVLDPLNDVNDNLVVTLADDIYEKNIYAVRFSANSIIHKPKKGYHKFWWTTELNEIKAKAIASCTVWKNAGKPRHGSIFQTYTQDKLLYKMRIKRNNLQKLSTLQMTFMTHLWKNLDESFGMFKNLNLKLPIVAMFLSMEFLMGELFRMPSPNILKKCVPLTVSIEIGN